MTSPLDGKPALGLRDPPLDAEGDLMAANWASTTYYHLHVNCYTQTPPPSLVAMREEFGLRVTRFDRVDAGSSVPLWIATKKVTSDREADHWFEEILTRLDADPLMRGYVESEAVRRECVARYTQRSFATSVAFPLSRGPDRAAARSADIHVFRDAETPPDTLDALLAGAGFYEVVNDRERIWTLLLGQREDGQEAFETLKQYFSDAGGISKLELEFVRSLVATPRDFSLGHVHFRA